MKHLIFILLLFTISCSTPDAAQIFSKEAEYDYFYYSYAAEMNYRASREQGRKPIRTLTYVDGVMYTCFCPPSFIDTFYRKNFPDVTLVKKVPKGQANHLIKIVE